MFHPKSYPSQKFNNKLVHNFPSNSAYKWTDQQAYANMAYIASPAEAKIFINTTTDQLPNTSTTYNASIKYNHLVLLWMQHRRDSVYTA